MPIFFRYLRSSKPIVIDLTSNEKHSKCGNGIMISSNEKPSTSRRLGKCGNGIMISSNEKPSTSRRLCDVCNLSLDDPRQTFHQQTFHPKCLAGISDDDHAVHV